MENKLRAAVPLPRRILLGCHRGDRKNFPENTMPAFEAALKLGCDMIEMDLHMTADGELVMAMSYGPFSVATGIDQGIYTETTQTFVFDNGTIGNTNYMAIGFNSPNKAGAMVVINAIISGEIQLTQYAQLRELPVVATEKLSDAEKAAFDAVDLGKGVLSQAELLAHRLPEMPASLVPVIEQIWLAEVVGK